ncbi:flagellar biosynthesis anti-sigma factor FlgM [Caminibacter sp.]
MIRRIFSGFNNFQIENSNQNRNKVSQTTKISRVEEIKRAIHNGTYKIDIEKTAKAMAKALLF